MDKTQNRVISLLKSSLPDLAYMMPYLERIESNRCHSNFGPLVKEFEERLSALLSLSSSQIVLLANGTLALQCALMAIKKEKGKYCILPSWTFSATPASAVMAGLTPLFVDVDRETQQLTSGLVLEHLKNMDIDANEVGALVVVSPFGHPVPSLEWDQFTENTGIPVLIDAAASFDAVHRSEDFIVGSSPIMVSLHATKLLGIGEGGFVVCNNTDIISRIRGLSCFGFDHTRVSSFVGTNAKMSEYQAAIGLGVLDAWPATREMRLLVTRNYINAFNDVSIKSWLHEDYLTSTCNLLTPGIAKDLCRYLNDSGVESRVWWGNGCHTHPAYQDFPVVGDLKNTQYLSNAMLGLPFSVDTSACDIQFIKDLIVNYITQVTEIGDVIACAV